MAFVSADRRARRALGGIGAGAPAAQRWCRRANTIGWLVSGQDATGKSLLRHKGTRQADSVVS